MYEIIYTMKLGGRISIKEDNLVVAKGILSYIKNRGDREGAIYKNPFHSTTDKKALVLWFGDDSYWDNVSKSDESILDKKM